MSTQPADRPAGEPAGQPAGHRFDQSSLSCQSGASAAAAAAAADKSVADWSACWLLLLLLLLLVVVGLFGTKNGRLLLGASMRINSPVESPGCSSDSILTMVMATAAAQSTIMPATSESPFWIPSETRYLWPGKKYII